MTYQQSVVGCKPSSFMLSNTFLSSPQEKRMVPRCAQCEAAMHLERFRVQNMSKNSSDTDTNREILTTLQPKRLVNVCGLCFRSTSLCRLPILVPQICVLVIEIVIYLWRLCYSINLNIKFLLVPKMKSVKRSYILDRRYRIKYCSHHKPKLQARCIQWLMFQDRIN